MSAKASTARSGRPPKGHGSASRSCECPGGGRRSLAVGQARAIALACLRDTDTRGERDTGHGKAEAGSWPVSLSSVPQLQLEDDDVNTNW